MSFLALPSEVVLDIADAVIPLRDINALSQTNRKLHRLLDPYLYQQALTRNDGEIFIASLERDSHGLARRLIREASRVNFSWTAFRARQKKYENYKTLRALEAKEQNHDINQDGPFNGYELLSTAIDFRDRTCVEVLLGWKGDELASNATSRGHDYVLRAAGCGYIEILQLLIERGFPLDCVVHNWSPLFAAVYNGRVSAVKLLLEAGASVHQRDKKMGWTPLAWALDPGAMNRDKQCHCCRFNYFYRPDGQEEMVNLLLKHGSDANFCDRDGTTLLQLANNTYSGTVVRPLLEAGADLASQQEDVRHTVFLHACSDKDQDLVGYLLDRHRDHILSVQSHHWKGRPYGVYSPGLRHGVVSGDYELVKTMLEWRADPDIVDERGDTPLMLAMRSTTADVARIVRILVRHGADPNAVNKDFETPLQLAMVNRNRSLVKILLDSGIDMSKYNDPITTVKILHTAIITGHGAIAELLLKRDPLPTTPALKLESPMTVWPSNRALYDIGSKDGGIAT
ncbi:ankyrin repeat-containing domain protein [Aspergillus ambiguus]|uniref:ankyrin repeat-containing domain protein n=1 Tax=Aspergillus ambiguus TaxID=176160 RepID=UPI003CCE2230